MNKCANCNQYLGHNFCADCGLRINIMSNSEKNVSEMTVEEIKAGIREKIIGMTYLTLKKYPSRPEKLKILMPLSLNDERSSQIFRIEIVVDELSYSIEILSIFDKIDNYLTTKNIFIVDIVDLEINEIIFINNEERVLLKIKNLVIYTKEEYEEKFYPFLRFCPNWLEKSFQFRKNVCVDYPNPNPDKPKFTPYIKDKIYVVSSLYSKILREKLSEDQKSCYDKSGEVLDLSTFVFNFKTVGKVKEKNLPVVMAWLNGMEVEMDSDEEKKLNKNNS